MNRIFMELAIVGMSMFWFHPRTIYTVLPEVVDKVNPGEGTEADFEQNTEDFIVKDGSLMEYRGHDTKVVIPENVVSIDPFAFMGNRDIVEITIPYGVTNIYEMTFYNCTSLKTVHLPETLRFIGDLAFAKTALLHLTLPESLETVGGGAFADCVSLKSVQMPQHPVEINDDAFARCNNLAAIDLSAVESMGEGAFDGTALTQVDISSLEKVWSETGGGMFTDTDVDFSGLGRLGMDTTKANPFRGSRYWKEYGKGEKKNTFWIIDGVLLSGQNCSGKVEIPAAVTKIAAYAFAGNTKITSVSIPATVTVIGRGAFSGCKRLRTASMKDSVTTLGKEAFYGCHRLSDIRLSNQLEQLGDELFLDCPKLVKLTLPEQVKTMDWLAISDTPSVTITMPSGIRGIQWLSGHTVYVTDMAEALQSPVFQEVARQCVIKELALNDTKLTLHVGEKYPLRFNSGAKATWKSSKRSVATVGNTGNIYAKKPGSTVITAKIYGREYTCKVKVVK